jgi:hypothetical protein
VAMLAGQGVQCNAIKGCILISDEKKRVLFTILKSIFINENDKDDKR